ncbi:hypothetical protein [Trujillonella humicola]
MSLAQALLQFRARAYREGRPLGELARDVLDGVVEMDAQQDDR